MQMLLNLAVAVGRLSRLDAHEILERQKEAGCELEELLSAGGWVDMEEFDWLAQMCLQDFREEELTKLRRQWSLARVAWSEKLFPEGAEVLPRFLLKHWAQRQLVTLSKLLESSGHSTECVFTASQLLASELRVCDHCLKVLSLQLGGICPYCQDGELGASAEGDDLLQLYRTLPPLQGPVELSVEALEALALETLKRARLH